MVDDFFVDFEFIIIVPERVNLISIVVVMLDGYNFARCARVNGPWQKSPLVLFFPKTQDDDVNIVGLRTHFSLDEPVSIAVAPNEMDVDKLALVIIDSSQLSHILDTVSLGKEN